MCVVLVVHFPCLRYPDVRELHAAAVHRTFESVEMRALLLHSE